MGPDRYAALRRDYLASAQGRALQGVRPQAGARSDTQVEYKIQSSAMRLFPGQQSEENCALQVCQQFIRATTGANPSEAEMLELGTNIAEYDPEIGTPVKQIPTLLRNEGVGANTFENTPETIQIGIENGQGVMANVDVGFLRTGTSNKEAHAVHVTNVVKDVDGTVTHYVINDTGTGEAGRKVSAKLFEQSLIPPNEKADVILTNGTISIGGRTASEARRKALKEYLINNNSSAQESIAENQSIPATADAVKQSKQAQVEEKGKLRKQNESRTDPLGRVSEPGEQIGKLDSYKTDADVPVRYRSDPRFKDLASDPDHNGAVKSGTRAEAMAGLEAESEGLISGPTKRGPKGTEFYDAQGKPWDVKAPPSPKLGDTWAFKADRVGRSILEELRVKATPKNAPAGTYPHENTGLPEPRRVILDSSYMTKKDHKALWEWLNNNLTSVELENIVEVKIKS